MKPLFYIGVLLLAFSCKQKTNYSWQLDSTITIPNIHPIGLTFVKDTLWLSDGDSNRLVQLSAEGKVIKTIDSLNRPMHIDTNQDVLFVPEYGNDTVSGITKNKTTKVAVLDSLDAPAGVSVYKNEMAVADFYNNRIHYYNGTNWMVFGEKGKGVGQFNYPTDVQITPETIWVADAYNNRIQAFNKQGKHLKTIGEHEKMNATTGIFVSKTHLFATDFENNRILVFNKLGALEQVITKAVDKPTDVILKNSTLWVLNYRNEKILLFKLKEEELKTP